MEVKERLEHGQFMGWVECNFKWSLKTANRMMDVFDKFKSDNLTDLIFQVKHIDSVRSNDDNNIKGVSTNDNKGNIDRIKLKETAKQLKDKGLNLKAIAEHFVSEGYMNLRGTVSWTESTISRLINK